MTNQIHFGSEVAENLRKRMIEEAEKIIEKHRPGYWIGKFDNYLLVRANKDLISCEYPNGCAAGTFLLANPKVYCYNKDKVGTRHMLICIWDMEEQIDIYVPFEDIDFIEKEVKLTLQLNY